MSAIPNPANSSTQARPAAAAWTQYAATTAIIAICGLLGWACNTFGLSNTNIAMIFLAAVALVAARFSRGPAIFAAVLSTLVFDYFFVTPLFTFARSDTQYLVTLAVMLGIGIFISELAARLQAQLRAAQHHEQQMGELLQLSRQQERRTALLSRMTRQLSELSGTEFLVPRAGRQLNEILQSEIVLFLRDLDGSLQLRYGNETTIAADSANLEAAEWVAENHRPGGVGTNVAPRATALFLPLVGSQRTIGVLGVRAEDARRFLDTEERRMLEACASLIALSIERDQSRVEAQQAQIRVQSERFRNTLLSAVSHDMRTPLATIAVTASSLLENSLGQNSANGQQMLQTVVDESHRLARQVDNLLEMARLNSGTLVLNPQWQVLEELVGVALSRLRMELRDRPIHVDIPADFPLLWLSSDLLKQVLVNLLENTIRYTPAGTAIEISARYDADAAVMIVADRGPGLPPGSEAKVFDKFYRGTKLVADGQRGIGLGLPICQGLMQAQGGTISAANRPTGGAMFTIVLHCPQQCPQINPADETDEPTPAVENSASPDPIPAHT
jgi:two-component system, OmpR family, sensor histidine kinase KdpD